jgi:hypothetical protein
MIFYAMKQLEFIGAENNFVPIYDGQSIYIQLFSGKTLSISESEIKYQASEYLKSELEMLNF